MRGNVQLSDFAHSHAEAPLVPARDDAADARVVRERFLPGRLRAPEDFPALDDRAFGVHGDCIALGDARARAWVQRALGGGVAWDRGERGHWRGECGARRGVRTVDSRISVITAFDVLRAKGGTTDDTGGATNDTHTVTL